MQNLVVKAELVPHREEVVYQKIALFGGKLNTHRVKIFDLEHITFNELYGENNFSETASRGIFNKEVAFRVKSTGELLFFDRNGVWHDEGLNH